MSGTKLKLTITQWDVKTKSAGSASFSAMLNPTGYSQSLQVKYSSKAIPGKAEPEVKYSCSMPETLELDELIIDGTGVLNSSTNSNATDVKSQIALLKTVAYEAPENDAVERPVVQIIWGTLSFLGRVDNIVVKYTMFKPSGEPLRAKVKLSFSEFQDTEEQAQSNSSTAMSAPTQQVQLTDNKSMPLVCFDVYQDSSQYMNVAKYNDLTSFLDISPGMNLLFPKGNS